MRLLFVADGRSPTALNWIGYFLETGHEVHLVSTFPCTGDKRLASFAIVPVAFSGVKSIPGAMAKATSTSPMKAASPDQSGQRERRGLWSASTVRLRTTVRQWLGPFTLPRAARQLSEIYARLRPDLVHAMRIPYEGMLATLAAPQSPLLISIWGNDFTLHAPATPLLGKYTRLALRRAGALHSDTCRDVRLAHAWGFSIEKPAVVLPGAGGVQEAMFYPAPQPVQTQVAINPRGVRAYVRNETFFRALPFVLERLPQARFLCPSMAAEPQVQRWVIEMGLTSSVELLPVQTRSQMADLFRSARTAISPAAHDGTPNTLLEAMACGCLPVAGDLESLREWIIPGMNGLLVDLNDPRCLAQAIIVAMQEDALYHRARKYNARLVAERALYSRVMEEAHRYYQVLAGKN